MPLPVPLAPDVIDNHAALLTAVQAHPIGVVTVMLPVADDSPTDRLVGERVTLHEAPDWLTVNVRFAIVSVPLLDVELGLLETL